MYLFFKTSLKISNKIFTSKFILDLYLHQEIKFVWKKDCIMICLKRNADVSGISTVSFLCLRSANSWYFGGMNWLHLLFFFILAMDIGGRPKSELCFLPAGWGERSCPRSATAVHLVVVDRTPNLHNNVWLLLFYYSRKAKELCNLNCTPGSDNVCHGPVIFDDCCHGPITFDRETRGVEKDALVFHLRQVRNNQEEVLKTREKSKLSKTLFERKQNKEQMFVRSRFCKNRVFFTYHKRCSWQNSPLAPEKHIHLW